MLPTALSKNDYGILTGEGKRYRRSKRGATNPASLTYAGAHCLIRIQSESVTDGAVDRCRVLLEHVVFGFEQPLGRLWHRRLRKREHLEKMSVEGDEIFFDESVSGKDVIVEMDL